MSVEVVTKGPFASSNGIAHNLNSRMDMTGIIPAQAPTHLDYKPTLDGANNSANAASTMTPTNPLGGDSIAPATAGKERTKTTPLDTTVTEGLTRSNGLYTPPESPGREPTTFSQDGLSPTSKLRRGLRPKGRTTRSSTSTENTIPPTSPSRADPFEGIQIPIPSGDLEDPFGPDHLKVSNRGTVYVAGEKARNIAKRIQPRVENTTTMAITTLDIAPIAESPEKVVPGNGSILSTESQTPSQRVRSLYEFGPENQGQEMDRPGSAAPSYQKDHTQEEALGEQRQTGLSPRHTTVGTGLVRGARDTSAMSSRTSLVRETGEAAGGVEDWTDVEAKDVDRYGFITRSRSSRFKPSSLQASTPGSPEASRGHRTITSLGVIDETEPTTSSFSPVPTVNLPNDKAGPRPPSSALSTSSRNSSTSRLNSLRSERNQQRRLIAGASTMLSPSFGTVDREALSGSLTSDPARRKLELDRSTKWQKMAIVTPVSPQSTSFGAGATFTFNTKDPKLISRTWKGIPDRWRATAWRSFLNASAARRSPTGRPDPSDSMLIARFHDLQDMDCLDDMQIDLDVPRTIGAHIMFRKRYRGGQRLLFRVLRALALYFPDVGYVQGMAAIASTLLCYFDEELAFVVAVRMWTLRGVAWLYTGGFEGLMEALDDFEAQWIGLGDKKQALKNKLEGLGVTATVWGTKWYLTLFNYCLPFQAQLRVWDVLFLLGDSLPSQTTSQVNEKKTPSLYPKPNLDVMHAVAASLLLGMKDRLMRADFDVTMEYLTGMVIVGEGGGEDVLMGVAKTLLKQKVK